MISRVAGRVGHKPMTLPGEQRPCRIVFHCTRSDNPKTVSGSARKRIRFKGE